VEVFVDSEFRALILPLAAEERKGLERDLLRDGCRDALAAVWRNAKTRCSKGTTASRSVGGHKITFKVVRAEIESREHAKMWIEENQVWPAQLE
jgi:hypothetical protein